MNTVETTKTRHARRGDSSKRLDRSLTVGGYTPSGRYKESTARLYADAWADFSSWCSSAGRTPMPATPETIATYAAYLIDHGYKPGTARSRITAVRSRHRQLGHPAPDNVAAWSVLRGAEPTRPPRQVKGIDRSDLLDAVETCGSDPAGLRNRALVLLAWDLTVAAPDFIGLDIDHVHTASGDQPATITIANRDVELTIEHDHDPIGLCPVCAARDWIAAMANVGIVSGPLFRPVDRLGVIEGSGISRAGSRSTTGCARLSKRSLYRVWTRVVAASGIEASTPRALRIGGARHRVQRTGDVGPALARAGWSPTTGAAVNRLLPS